MFVRFSSTFTYLLSYQLGIDNDYLLLVVLEIIYMKTNVLIFRSSVISMFKDWIG